MKHDIACEIKVHKGEFPVQLWCQNLVRSPLPTSLDILTLNQLRLLFVAIPEFLHQMDTLEKSPHQLEHSRPEPISPYLD